MEKKFRTYLSVKQSWIALADGEKKKLEGSDNWAFLNKYTLCIWNTHQMIFFHRKTQSQVLLERGIKSELKS